MIEAALAVGMHIPEVAVRFRVPENAVRYHRSHHLPPTGSEGAGGSTADTDEGQR